jgi:hypothetical protein
MAVKTFTTGEVLTSSDTNTYLANAGWVYVTSVSVGSTPVQTVSISNAFSSTYTEYMIKVVGIKGNAQVGMAVQLNGITSGYDYNGFYMLRGSSALNGFNTVGASGWDAGATDTTVSEHTLYIMNPNVAAAKTCHAHAVGIGGTTLTVEVSGYQTSTATATGFSFYAPVGYTITQGTIAVYGLRKA